MGNLCSNGPIDFDANQDGRVDIADAVAVARGTGRIRRRRRRADGGGGGGGGGGGAATSSRSVPQGGYGGGGGGGYGGRGGVVAQGGYGGYGGGVVQQARYGSSSRGVVTQATPSYGGGVVPQASRYGASSSSSSRAASAPSSSSSIASSMMDVNGDGRVDVADAMALASGRRRRSRAGGSSSLVNAGLGMLTGGGGGGGGGMAASALGGLVGGGMGGMMGGGGGGGYSSSSSSSTTGAPATEVMTSTCTGRRRALFIGINYVGTKAELKGCHNDVRNVHAFFSQTYGFTDVRMLLDDGRSQAPTRAAIIDGMRWLVEGAREGDSLLLDYSGHGGTSADRSGLETDGQAETLIPLDYKTAGIIDDDDVHEILLTNLPAGVRLTAIIDACHSGSVLDLPYAYTIDGNLDVQEVDIRAIVIQGVLGIGQSLLTGNKARAMQGLVSLGMSVYQAKTSAGGTDAQQRAEKLRRTNCDAIQFSGCQDSQTSADAFIGGSSTGAMTWALLSCLNENKHYTYVELLKNMRAKLAGKYEQIPQLTAGRRLNLQSPFKC